MRESFVVVLFGDVVEGGSQAFKDEAVVVTVREAFDVADDVRLVLWVVAVDFLDDGSLRSSGGDVFFNRLNHLTWLRVTFIAYVLYL